jgi:hypothetical protein
VQTLRALEAERIKRLRSEYAEAFKLAEDVLEFATAFIPPGKIPVRPGHDAVVLVLLSFHAKIMAELWAIIVLCERGLPASSLSREMLEALISVAYIAKEDSEERARLYVDFVAVRDAKDMRTE